MAMEYSEESPEEGKERLRGIHAIKESLKNEVDELETLAESLREKGGISEKELQYSDEIIQKGRDIFSGINNLLNDGPSADRLRQDLASGTRKPSSWGPKTRELDQLWHEGLNLIEEIRWEKQRLMQLTNE